VLSFAFLGLIVLQNLLVGRLAQGVGLGIVVAFCLAASIWARRARLVGNMDSINGMIELTLGRARKSLRIAQATYAVIAISAIAAALDAQSTPGQGDLFGVRIVLLAICAAATAVYHFYVRARIRRFESIRRSFGGHDFSVDGVAVRQRRQRHTRRGRRGQSCPRVHAGTFGRTRVQRRRSHRARRPNSVFARLRIRERGVAVQE
jgi:hypothetical protein